jgi:hypothetical protein
MNFSMANIPTTILLYHNFLQDIYANPQSNKPKLDITFGSNSGIVELVNSLEKIKTDAFINPEIINPL